MRAVYGRLVANSGAVYSLLIAKTGKDLIKAI